MGVVKCKQGCRGGAAGESGPVSGVHSRHIHVATSSRRIGIERREEEGRKRGRGRTGGGKRRRTKGGGTCSVVKPRVCEFQAEKKGNRKNREHVRWSVVGIFVGQCGDFGQRAVPMSRAEGFLPGSGTVRSLLRLFGWQARGETVQGRPRIQR